MQAVDGQRLAFLCRLGKKSLRRGEKIDEANAIRLGHFGHGIGVVLKIRIILPREGIIPVLMLLGGDRREEHYARSPFSTVVLLREILEERVQVRLELFQPLVPLERLVKAVEGEDHVGPRPGQPLVTRTEVLRTVPSRDFVTGG